jgi:hypothetical protein
MRARSCCVFDAAGISRMKVSTRFSGLACEYRQHTYATTSVSHGVGALLDAEAALSAQLHRTDHTVMLLH